MWRGVDGEMWLMPIFPVGDICMADLGADDDGVLPLATINDNVPPVDARMPCWVEE